MAEDASFYSVLFTEPPAGSEETRTAPECFRDLNLDQVVSAVTAGREEYDLVPFLYTPLSDRDEIVYRQDILRDIEQAAVRAAVCSFAISMQRVRAYQKQADALHFRLQRQRWFLDSTRVYCEAVQRLRGGLANGTLNSRGLRLFRDYLARVVESQEFATLLGDAAGLLAQLSSIEYAILIRGDAITVRRHEGEPDYSSEVLATFERFKRGTAKDYRVDFDEMPQMNHVEEKILDLVARLYPQTFNMLDAYCNEHAVFVDETIGRFDREVQFYLAFLEYIEPMRSSGLAFSYPVVSSAKSVFAYRSFDLALAAKLQAEGATVVCNDFHVEGAERIIVVSGPNQGGKSTFARMFAQLHYIARLGCMVPGERAKLFLCDHIFTHFEREEDIAAERGKLEDDLLRIHVIVERATSNSIVILNEIFTSTTLRDAILLSKKIAAELIQRDMLCVWVTFIDEIASYGPQTVSMMSTVKPDDLAVRTYKIVRKPATGRAYALSIAEKYGLTYDALKGRMRR